MYLFFHLVTWAILYFAIFKRPYDARTNIFRLLSMFLLCSIIVSIADPNGRIAYVLIIEVLRIFKDICLAGLLRYAERRSSQTALFYGTSILAVLCVLLDLILIIMELMGI